MGFINSAITNTNHSNKFKFVTKIDDMTLIQSGVLFIHNNTISFDFEEERMKVEIYFKKNNEKKAQMLGAVDPDNENKFILTLTNFTKDGGAGISSPRELMTIRGTEIFFSFFVLPFADDSLQFSYAFLCKEGNEKRGE